MAARWLRGGINGPLQFSDQLWNGAIQVTRDVAEAAPVARLLRMDPDGVKEHRRRNVMGMGDKRDRHPGPDGLVGRADLAQPVADPGGEDEGSGDRQHEEQPNRQRALPRGPHNGMLTIQI
ncbi:hypothetical protein SBA3_5030008 [Candidatus Sulfopaludibacter sp. SbA3]|nr:hypothetical protein SBA3_5030008 [Candidatus Sulfopaludibacter sp. SbA3]